MGLCMKGSGEVDTVMNCTICNAYEEPGDSKCIKINVLKWAGHVGTVEDSRRAKGRSQGYT